MNLLAVDPGLRNPAVAFFKDGQLVYASRVKIPTANHKLPVGQRCLNVANLCLSAVELYAFDRIRWNIDELVIEWPRVYRGAKSKGDPADLFPLAGVGMAIAGKLNVPVISPLPQEWIGSLSKNEKGDPLESPRGQRIWSRLSEEERAVVVVSHDAIDSVGLGLFRLGRLERVRSFIGAT